MNLDTNQLSSLSPAEKMELIEFLWEDLDSSSATIPLPDWVDEEAARRRKEMIDQGVGLSHNETWQRIQQRHE